MADSTDRGDITGGGRWCGARKRQGEGHCRRPAGWGTTHPGYGTCKLHGGCAAGPRKGAARLKARAELARLGQPMEMDPLVALELLVWEAAGNVAFLRGLVQELEPSGTTVVQADDEEGDSPGKPGLYGRINPKTWEARPHVLVGLYNEERDRLAKVAKLAHEAGVEERHVAQAERYGELVARAMAALLDDPALALTREQRELGRRAAGQHLRALGSGEPTP